MNSKKRTIMLDARVVIEGEEHGIARHARELILNIVKNKNHEKLNFIILVNNNSPFLKNSFPSNFKVIILKYGLYSLFSQIEIILKIFKYKPNFFHSPHFIVPLLSHIPLIATIHDMNHMVLAKNYSLKQKIYYNIFLKLRLLKAINIITVSLFSKNEITKLLGVPENKIQVIYNGVFNNFKPLSHFSEQKTIKVVTDYNLPKNYFFALGNHKPHKNLERLTEAYCTGKFTIPLVILTDRNENLLKIAEKYDKKQSIHFLKFVKEEDFPLLYALSTAFIFVSLYEGFGLPPLEASACGTPVIVSNTTSLPEVMDNAAIYVNPESIKDIQRGMNEVLSENKIVIQNNIQNGLTLAKKYSWERMAQETLELYDSV